MSLSLVHARLANTVLMYFIAMMLWAFWRFFRKEDVDPNFRGALVISEILILLQGLLGGILWLNHGRPEQESMHLLYGIIAIAGIPAVYTFSQKGKTRYEMLAYGAVYFSLIAIVIRSMMTG